MWLMNGRVVWCEVGGGSFIYRVLCCVQEISSFLLRLLSVIPCSGSPGPLTLPPHHLRPQLFTEKTHKVRQPLQSRNFDVFFDVKFTSICKDLRLFYSFKKMKCKVLVFLWCCFQYVSLLKPPLRDSIIPLPPLYLLLISLIAEFISMYPLHQPLRLFFNYRLGKTLIQGIRCLIRN